MTASVSINLSTNDPGLFHPTVDGHVSCLHVLATVGSTAVNTGVHVSFGVTVFSRFSICLGVGLLGRVVVLFLVF